MQSGMLGKKIQGFNFVHLAELHRPTTVFFY